MKYIYPKCCQSCFDVLVPHHRHLFFQLTRFPMDLVQGKHILFSGSSTFCILFFILLVVFFIVVGIDLSVIFISFIKCFFFLFHLSMSMSRANCMYFSRFCLEKGSHLLSCVHTTITGMYVTVSH